ncbi:hypothetical protein Tco_1031145 [Tanacetum coccineum]|uniref:Ribosomal protein S4 n=1 Tax=Tanacetum coccineum TaxID=301880 RepID=A0ABQ5G8C4_9ASTR
MGRLRSPTGTSSKEWSKDWEKVTKSSLLFKAVVPIEIIVEPKRIQNFNVNENKKRRRENLNILKERKEIALIREAYYKQKLEGYYNKCVRPSTFKTSTYLVNISKRRAFWSLNEDILKITILKTNTSYPSWKIRHIHQGRYGVSVPTLTKDHKGMKLNTPYPEDVNTPYLRYSMRIFWKISNVVHTLRKPQYAVSNSLDMPYRTDFQTL